MDQSEVLRFEQQKQIMKLSQAIREGAKLTRPTKSMYLNNVGEACILGAAALGSGYTYTMHAGGREPVVTHLCKTLQVSSDVLKRIEGRWSYSSMTREQIADELERLGY